jgi:lambda family phage tail tape measure protein
MINTGLQVGIDATQAQAGAASFKTAVMSMADQAGRSFDQIQKSISNMTGSVFNLKNALLGLGITEFTRSIMDASMQMDRIRLTMQASTQDVETASGNYAILREMVNKLALDLPTAAQQFAQMSAAAKGTSLEGEGVQHIFEGISTAMTALNATSQHTEFALYAVQQMISKGVVSMEELRRQLGDNLIGAFQLAGEAMGVTTAQLTHMVKQGQLLSSDFLPKLADVLINRYGNAATKAAELTAGMMKRITTAFFDLKLVVANSDLRNEFDNALKGVLTFMRSDEIRQAARELGTTLGTGIHYAAEAMQFLAMHGSEVLQVLVGFTALKIGMWFIDLTIQVQKLTKALMELQFVQTAMSALSGFSSGGIKTTPVQWAGKANTPTFQRLMANETESGFDFFAKNGRMLNSSQFNMRAQSFGGDKAAAKAEFEAMNMLLDKNGNLLKQNTLEARLNSTAWKDASFATRSMTQSMAEQVGLMITFNALIAKGGPLLSNFAKYLWEAGAAVLTGGIGQLGGILVSAGNSMVALLGLIPGWGWLTLAIIGVTTALYAFRDTTLTFEGHSAKLKYWLQVPWKAFRDEIILAWDALKKLASDGVVVVEGFVEDIKGLWQRLAPDFLKNAWSTFADWLSTTWAGRVKDAIKDALGGWAKQAEANQNADEEAAFDAKIHRVFSPEQIAKVSKDFWKGIFTKGTTESEMIDYRDQALAAYQRNHQPPAGKDEPVEGKLKRDRPGDTIKRLAEEIKATSSLIDLNEKYVLDEDALGDAIARTNAVREAEEKIISLNLAKGDARADVIRKEYLTLDLLKERLKAVENLRKQAFNDIQDIQQTALMTEAIKMNEVAVHELDVQLKADQAVRKAGAGLRDEEKDWLRDIVKVMEALHYQQQLITEGKQISESLNPLQALGTELLHLNVLLEAGAISWTTYQKAVIDSTQKADAARIEDLKKHGGWVDGITAGLEEVDLEFKKTGERAYQAFKNVWSQLSDDLVKFLDTGKFSLASFAQSVVHEINKSIVDSALHGLSQRLKAGLQVLVGEVQGGGGIMSGLKDAFGAVFKGKGVTTKSPAQQAADDIKTTINHSAALQGSMQKVIEGLKTELSDLMQRAQAQNAQLMEGLGNGFSALVNTNETQWGTAITEVQNAFSVMIQQVGAEFHIAIAGAAGGGGGFNPDTPTSGLSPFPYGPNQNEAPVTNVDYGAGLIPLFDEAGNQIIDSSTTATKQNENLVTSVGGQWNKVVTSVDSGFHGIFKSLGSLIGQMGAGGAANRPWWQTLIMDVAGAAVSSIGAGGGDSGGGGGSSSGIGVYNARGGITKFAAGGTFARQMSRSMLQRGGVKSSPHFVMFGERGDGIPEAFIPMMDRQSIQVAMDSMGNAYAPTPGGMRIPVTLSRFADGGMYDDRYRTNSVSTSAMPSMGEVGNRGGHITVNQTINTPDANSFRKSRNQINADMWNSAQSAKKRL